MSYVVTEFVPGSSLADRLKERPSLSEREAPSIAGSPAWKWPCVAGIHIRHLRRMLHGNRGGWSQRARNIVHKPITRSMEQDIRALVSIDADGGVSRIPGWQGTPGRAPAARASRGMSTSSIQHIVYALSVQYLSSRARSRPGECMRTTRSYAPFVRPGFASGAWWMPSWPHDGGPDALVS